MTQMSALPSRRAIGVTGNTNVGGTLGVTGTSNLAGLNVGATAVSTTLSVMGATSLVGGLGTTSLNCSGNLLSQGVVTINNDTYINGNLYLSGAFLQNVPLVITNPSAYHNLTINDAGRNIFINNSTQITNIRLPRLNTITNNRQVILSFVVQSIVHPFNIWTDANDGNIVGSVINNDGATSRIDSSRISCSSLLKPGDNINLSNFPNGSLKSWFISSGGLNTTGSGFVNGP
jgi:hypothetical protein